jgi:uncharacterized membrane protein YeiH
MDVPPGFNPTLILVLNLAGTFVFGISGGLAAVRARLDLLGVVVLATVVALAGGITRDLLIGTPPATVRDWRYLAAAGLAGLVCFFAGSVLERFERSVMVFDAIGLSLFAVMLRDLLLGEIPTVLREGLYAVPAMLGAAVLVVGEEAGSTSPVFPVLGAALCMVVRLLGLKYGLTLPIARSEKG